MIRQRPRWLEGRLQLSSEPANRLKHSPWYLVIDSIKNQYPSEPFEAVTVLVIGSET